MNKKYRVIDVNNEIHLLVIKKIDNGQIFEVWFKSGTCNYNIGDLI